MKVTGHRRERFRRHARRQRARAARTRVAVLARHPAAPATGTNGRSKPVVATCSIRPPWAGAIAGRDAVIHLVGIIHEEGTQTFDVMHRQAVGERRRAQRESAFVGSSHERQGTAEDSPSEYGRTKAAGERVVAGSGLDWTIFRPSIVSGPGGRVRFAAVRRSSRRTALHSGHRKGETKFQTGLRLRRRPRFSDALEKPETIGRTFDVGGRGLTLNEVSARSRRRLKAAENPRPSPALVGKDPCAGLRFLARRGLIDARRP